MTTISTCPDSLCEYRNSFGYCTLNGSCIYTNKTTGVSIQKEVTALEKTITPDVIRKELMELIDSLCIWETPEKDGDEFKTRCLFYIQGAYDMADQLIKRLEGKK